MSSSWSVSGANQTPLWSWRHRNCRTLLSSNQQEKLDLQKWIWFSKFNDLSSKSGFDFLKVLCDLHQNTVYCPGRKKIIRPNISLMISVLKYEISTDFFFFPRVDANYQSTFYHIIVRAISISLLHAFRPNTWLPDNPKVKMKDREEKQYYRILEWA